MGEQLEQFRMLIGGKAADASSGRTFESENPYTGRPWAVIPDAGPEDVDAAVQAARGALEGEWGQLTGFDRSRLIRLLGNLVSVNSERLARLEVQDSGKLYREMIGQLNGLAGWYHYYAGLADKLEGRQIPTPNPNYLVYTRREPVGVVAAITPWNSPLLLMTWKVAPALAAGCTLVIKPSEHAPASTLGFAELITEAGFPPGVVNVVTGQSREVGAALAGHPGVDKVAFTGSTATGRAVAHAAAENLNPVTLELGGKSPQIVFPDADLAAAANGIVAGRVRGHRADLHGRLAADRARRRARRTHPAGRRAGIADQARRPERARRPRWARSPTSRSTRRCSATCGPRWTRAPRSPTAARRTSSLGGYFVKPTVLTGVGPTSTVVPGGGVRPGAVGLRLHRRGRGGRAGQRHAVRPGRRGMDRGHAARAPGRGPRSRPAPSGSTPTGWSRRASRSAGSRRPGWAGRTASTRSTSTPRTRRLGRAHRRHPRPLHPGLT